MTTCTHPSFVQMPAAVSGLYIATCTVCEAPAYGSVVCTPEQAKAARDALYADCESCTECGQKVLVGGHIHPVCARRSEHAGW